MCFMQYDYEPRLISANIHNVPILMTNVLRWFDNLLAYTSIKFC